MRAPAPDAAATAVHHADLSREDAIRRFAGANSAFYLRAFLRIGTHDRRVAGWNWAAALLGPVWLGARRLWGAFWPFLILELLGWIVLAQGAAGSSGSDAASRAGRLGQLAAQRLAGAQQAAATQSPLAESLRQSAAALAKAADEARAEVLEVSSRAPLLLALGIAMVLAVRLVLALMANGLLERRFRRWRIHPELPVGLSLSNGLAAAGLGVLIVPITLYAFTAAAPPAALLAVPVQASWHTDLAAWLDVAIGSLSQTLAPISLALTRAITGTLDLLELCLVRTPWPVVMVIVLALAWQLAGRKVFLLTAFALGYLGMLGYWQKSMETVALLGTAAFTSTVIGIPVGVLCGYNPKVARIVRPILDFMQTMPAFVYLIPVIALFGIGKPAGIIATVIFGMPPIVRLTTLGIQGVPPTVREAALAFGATRSFLLTRIDLPLAAPSIMIGVNQTILMCLSMVVIASLIGAKGLGEEVLNALQYAAQGEGILAGLAILSCAIVLDRIVQGRAAASPGGRRPR